MSDTDPELIARFLTDDPDIFNEAAWGWAVRGEDPLTPHQLLRPEQDLKPKRRRSRNSRETEDYEPEPRPRSKSSIDDTVTRIPGVNNRELEDEKDEEALEAELVSDDWVNDLLNKQKVANKIRRARGK